MKLLLLPLLSLLPLSNAYFSEGWQPGQPATKYLTSTTSAPFAVPTIAGSKADPKESWSWKELKEKFSVEELLKSEAVESFLGRFGVNVTKSLEIAREAMPPRFSTAIPLVTDDNYETILFNETFTSPREEADRVWVLLVTIGVQDPVSAFYDTQFDAAHDLTLKANDLPDVRWGRIDYLDVTDLTTRWLVFKAPLIIIATDRGQTLRFYKHGRINMKSPETLRNHLFSKAYLETPPWDGPWSPRGSRAPYLNRFAKFTAYWYGWLAVAPKWLLLLITGSIASVTVNFLHSWDAKSKAKAKGPPINTKPLPRVTVTPASEGGDITPSTTSSPKKQSSPAKKRKGNKK